MAAPAVSVYPGAASIVRTGGEAVTAIFGPMLGGIITNPAGAADQGIAVIEPLYVDIVNPANVGETATTAAIQPGGSFIVPLGLETNVSVNAATSGHRFSAICYQTATPYPPTPQTGTFPPAGPTTLTETLPAYAYQQYDDDEDVDAFFTSYNDLAQDYVGWFAESLLPVYGQQRGSTLDWVAEGLYGIERPSLGSGVARTIGPFNTYAFNTLAYNRRKTIGASDVTATSDDVFQRIMTWNLYRGDGMTFNIRWLKRRIMRFLIGENGSAPNIDETYPISVTYGPGVIAIAINVGTREITGGALFNRHGFNRVAFNALQTVFIPASGTQYPLAPVLQEAIRAGVLQFPFQYQVSITI